MFSHLLRACVNSLLAILLFVCALNSSTGAFVLPSPRNIALRACVCTHENTIDLTGVRCVNKPLCPLFDALFSCCYIDVRCSFIGSYPAEERIDPGFYPEAQTSVRLPNQATFGFPVREASDKLGFPQGPSKLLRVT